MAGKFSIEAIFKGNDQISKVIASIEGRAGKFAGGLSKGLKEIASTNDKIIKGLSDIAKKAAVAGLAVGAIGVAGAINVGTVGADFEQAVSGIAAVSLTTVDKVEDLRLKALELAQAGKYSATEIAHGMEELGRAGLSNQEVMQGIAPILAAATAEGAEFTETAENITSIIKGMGLGFDQTARVADVLTVASAATKSSINSLGESMATLAPTARQLNVPLEDAVAMVASLQDVGLDASVAGSAVVSMLNGMAKPSDEIAAKMKAMGVSFRTASGDMIAPKLVLEQLVKAGKKAGGNLDQVAFFADLVGLRGQKAALNLKELFVSGKYQELTKNLGDVAGKAQQMADTKMDNFKGDLTTLSNTVDTVKIALFDLEKGPLRGVVAGTTSWVKANRQLIVADVEKFIVGVADALPKIVIWGERIGKIVLVVGSFMLAVKIATGALALFNAVAAMNPWVLLVYALVALTAVVVAFWPEIKKHELAFRRVGVVIEGVTAAVVAAAVVYGVFLLVTNASTIATIAYVGWVLASRAAVALWTIATNAQAIKTGILTGIQWVQTGAVAAYNGVLGIAQGAMALFSGEAVTMGGAMTAAAGPVLALVAALAALYLVKKANDSLKTVTGGLGVTGIASEMYKQGTFSPFKAVDEYQNQQARAKAGLPETPAAAPAVPGMPAIPGMPAVPGMPGQDPQAMIAALLAQQGGLPGATSAKGQAPAQTAKETGESLAKAMGPALTEALKKGKGLITVTVKGGKGEVEQQPESGFELLMTPSGGF